MKVLKYNISILSFTILLFIVNNCSVVFYRPNKISSIDFKYDSLSRTHNGPHNEKPFPLTVKNGINSYASTTVDGNDLFFASNARGNYDIYYRNLNTSSMIAITDHPSNETKPAISPDGQTLAYVSEEYDSDGDIIIVKLDLEAQEKNYSKGRPPLKIQDFIVATNPDYKDTNRIIRAIDTDPIWSHDGRFIVFTTSRFDRGKTNIALIDTKNNYSIRQLTFDGGTSPAFSYDDAKIYYLSYKDSSLGEIYELDLLSSKERRITSDNYKDLSPAASNDGRYLIYSSIRKDTNANGKLEGRDHAIIIRYDLNNGKSVELTAGNYSLFDTRYSNLNDGSILFTAALDNALNIYFIPVDGVIPKQDNIKRQYEFTRYYNELSVDFYKLAIEAIEQYFSDDNLFYLYRSKSEIQLVRNYFQNGRIDDGQMLLKQMLQTKSDPNEGLSYALASEFQQRRNGKDPLPQLLQYYEEISSNKNAHPQLSQGILFKIAESYDTRKEYDKAYQIRKEIIQKYPNFYDLDSLKIKLGTREFDLNPTKIPNYYIELLGKPSTTREDNKKIIEDILREYRETKNYEERIQKIEKKLISQSNLETNPELIGLLKFAKAEALNKLSRNKECIELIESYKGSVHPGGYVYLASDLLEAKKYQDIGLLEESQKEIIEFVTNYNYESGIDVNSNQLESSLQFFESQARIYELEGEFHKSSETYSKIDNILSYAIQNRVPIQNLIDRYGTYFQKKYVETVINEARANIIKEDNSIISQVNLVTKLDIQGNTTINLARIFRSSFFRIFGDFRDIQYLEYFDDDVLDTAENKYENKIEHAREILDRPTIFGYAYFLISRATQLEENYKQLNSLTSVRKKFILSDLKKAEKELYWIIYSDPTFVDAYLLLGWLHQYIDIRKNEITFPEEEIEGEVYASAYETNFPEKYLEQNVDLYLQLLEFKGDKIDKKTLFDIQLNLGNNYFLLNNHKRALQSYELVNQFAQSIITKSRFENYKQESMFYFNYGRAKVYNGKSEESIPIFRKAINLYYNKEYYPYVSIKNEASVLSNTKNKLAILHALVGISQMEIEEYEEAISSFSTSIKMNGYSGKINDINLYNAIAICYQKIGEYDLSEDNLQFAENEYEDNKPAFDWELFSIWNIILPDKNRVIGDGRFPGEMPLEFANLLTQGIRIKNNIENRDFTMTSLLIENRKKFIESKSMDRYVMGDRILDNTINELAYNQFIRGNYKEASSLYLKEFQLYYAKNEDKLAFKFLKRAGISLYSHFEENSDEISNLENSLRKEIDFLHDLREKEMVDCLEKNSPKNLKSSNAKPESITINFCDQYFDKEFHQFDVLLGYNYFYLAEIKMHNKDLLEAFSYYGKSIKLLHEPAHVTESKQGLANDPFSNKERSRLKIAVAIAYLRIGDLENFEKKILDAFYFANEFHFEREVLQIYILQSEYYYKYSKNKNEILLAETYSARAENLLKKSPGLFLEIDEILINNLFKLKLDINVKLNKIEDLNSDREKFYSAIFFRQILINKLDFQDEKLFGKLTRIRSHVQTDREVIRAIERNLSSGKTIKSLENTKAANYQQLFSELSEFSGSLPKGMDILSWFDKPNPIQFTKENDEIILNLFDSGHKLIISSFYRGIKKSESFDLQNLEAIDELGNILFTVLEKYPNVRKIILIPDPLMHSINFNRLKVGDNLLNDKYEIRYLFRLSEMVKQNPSDLQRLRRITGIDSTIQKEETILDDFLFSPLERIIKPAELEEVSLRKLNYRIIPYTDLKLYLTDTDVIEGSTDFANRKFFLGEKRPGFLNMKEIIENQWNIPIVVINNYRRSRDNFLKMGFLFDTLHFAGVKTIILIEGNADSERIRNRILSGIKDVSSILKDEKITIIGEPLPKINDNDIRFKEKYFEFTKLAITEEKNKKYLEAMKYFLSANSMIDENDKELQLESEINIARINTRFKNKKEHLYYFTRLNQKFKEGSVEESKILMHLLVECFESDLEIDCNDAYAKWMKNSFVANEEKEIITYYKNLKEENNNYVFKNYKTFVNLKLLGDPYLRLLGLANMFSRSFYWEQATFYSKKAREFASSKSELEYLDHIRAEIYEERFFIKGEFPPYDIGDSIYSDARLRSWSDYNFKLDKKLREEKDYYIRNYLQRIYSAYEKLESSSDFEPLELSPLFLKDGQPSLIRLSSQDRNFLFYILTRSISFQKGNELNRQFDLLLDTERNLGHENRAAWMKLEWARALYYRGDYRKSRDYLDQYEDAVDNPQKEIQQAYVLIKAKLSLIYDDIELSKRELVQLRNDSNAWFSIYTKVINAKNTNTFTDLLKEFLRNNNFILDDANRSELSDLIQLMKQKALKENNYSEVLDLAFIKDKFASYNRKTLGREPKFSDISIPNFSVASKIITQLPIDQNFKFLIDLGVESHLIEIDSKKFKSRKVIADNRITKFEILDYIFSIKDEGVNVLKQKRLEYTYRELLGLEINKLSYLYLPSFHFKVVIKPNRLDRFYFVLNPELMVSRKSVSLKDKFRPGFSSNIYDQSLDLKTSKGDQLLKELENMEVRLSNKGNDKSVNISQEILELKSGKQIYFGGRSLPSLQSLNVRNAPWVFAGAHLANTSLKSDDFVHSMHFIDQMHYGPGILNNVYQEDTHTAFFLKEFLINDGRVYNLFPRYYLGYQAIRRDWKEDRYWNGWKPYTNTFVKD